MFSGLLKGFNGGIRSKYSVSSKPLFVAGPWSVYSGKKRGNSSDKHDTPDAVSVLIFDKKAFNNHLMESGVSKKLAEEVYGRLRREVTTLAKIRHPSVLRIIEPLEESKSSMAFVTEPLTSCLKSLIDAKNRGSNTPGADDELDELVIQRGLLQICDGLLFLHDTAGFVHLNLEPSSIVVDAKGDWKLFGFKFAENYKEQSQYFIEQVDPRLTKYLQVNLDYASPELINDHKVDPSNDIFSLGCLILCIYNCSPPLSTNNNLYDYKDQLPTMTRALRNPNIPAYFGSILPQLIKMSAIERISIQALKSSEFFNNPLVKIINFLDDFPGKLASEKKVFLQGLQTMLPQFPKSTRQRKILQSLLEELGKDESVVYLLLKNVFYIGSDMSQLGFTEKILPAIARVKNEAGCQAAILDSLDVFLSRLAPQDFETSILPVLILVLQSSDPEHQRQVLSSVKPIVEKLDYLAMKTEIFPATCDLFSKTTSLSVKLECLQAFSVFISHELDKFTITEKLIPLLGNMKTRESQIIMAALDVYSSFLDLVDIEVLATQIIPQILALSMESSLYKQQFHSIMETVRRIIGRIEEDHGKKLSTAPPGGSNNNIGSSSTSTPRNAAQALSDPLSFDDLINKPSVNSSATNSGGGFSASANTNTVNNGKSNDDLLSFSTLSPSSNTPSYAPSNSMPSFSSPVLQPINKTPMNQLSNISGMNSMNNLNSMSNMNSMNNMNNMSSMSNMNTSHPNYATGNNNFSANGSFGLSNTMGSIGSFGSTNSFGRAPHDGSGSNKPLQPLKLGGDTSNKSFGQSSDWASSSDSNEFGSFQKSPTSTIPAFPRLNHPSIIQPHEQQRLQQYRLEQQQQQQREQEKPGGLNQYQSLL